MILILGGVKSGKSSWAARLAGGREHLGPVVYLATARAGDDEMAARIRRHRDERPPHWLTVEEPDDPSSFFEQMTTGAPAYGMPSTVLMDCLTLWLTNLLEPLGENPDRDAAFAIGEREGRRLLEAVLAWEAGEAGAAVQPPRLALLVSNQVETGLVSPWPLGRVFQELAGLTHQLVASRAAGVYLMSAGIPQRIK